MKSWMKWAAAALVVILIGVGVARALSARKTQQDALAKQTTQKAEAVVELSPIDLVQVKSRELSQGIAVSGSLKAVNSAFVKVRVAGELQGLTLREGDAVKAGQVLARVESTEYKARVRQAQQQAESAKAQVDIAKRTFENNRSLVNQGFISSTALESSSASLAAAQANYQAAQAGADVAAKALDDTVLRAPISGVVAQRLAQSGERVGVDAKVLEIVDLGKLELEASLGATDSMQVRVGQTASLQIEGTSKPVTARVVRINPTTAAGSRAVLVYLSIDSASGLRQGLFGQGSLNTGRAQALTVPLNAVRTDKPTPYVQWVNNNQVVHQPVELGARGDSDGQLMVAIQGVPENALLVAGSVGPLRAGTAVKVTPGAP
jgi:RND family efflux transporter MFP subunit